jgi:anti-sigma regulatory factor (Ser/Thr protein kinase)
MAKKVQPHLRALTSVPPMESPREEVRLTVTARPENVSLIRHVLGAVAETLRLPDSTMENLRLAVTEACTNVVRHAYGEGRPGAIELAMRPADEALVVVVSDRGRGIGTSGDTTGPGLGLPLIAALADDVEVEHTPGAGTRVAMTFSRFQAAA